MKIFRFFLKIVTNRYFIYSFLIGTGVFLLRKLFFFLWYLVAFSHSEVKKIEIDLFNAETNLKFVQSANDSLVDVIVDCSTTNLLIQDQNQKNIDSLWRANKELRKINAELNSQIDHFIEVAPCKKEVKIRDGNPFKKNKKEWVLIDCDEIE